MKDLNNYIQEGFFSNVGVNIQEIKEWILNYDGRINYYDYRFSFDTNNCIIRAHYRKHKTNKNDIIIDIKEIYDYVKIMGDSAPPCSFIHIHNKHTLSQRAIWIHEQLYGKTTSIIAFGNMKGTLIEFKYDHKTQKIEYFRTR